ncbi:MAG: helix-turn-helix transcriptional regulator [Clostridia bacterium]|nr:helix-turn-helix transcriptional regulator [Clostridia bacterium]
MIELDYKKIGVRIKQERLNRSISQEKLAELINMSKEHVSHIECGTTKLSLPTLVKLCNALEITPDLILLDSIYKSKEYLKDEFANIIKGCNELDMRLILDVAKAIVNVKK